VASWEGEWQPLGQSPVENVLLREQVLEELRSNI
jgi:hypothetical protein